MLNLFQSSDFEPVIGTLIWGQSKQEILESPRRTDESEPQDLFRQNLNLLVKIFYILGETQPTANNTNNNSPLKR